MICEEKIDNQSQIVDSGCSVPGSLTREQITKLESAMREMPQAEMVTEHYFIPGAYCRKLFRRAGTVIVGKVHKAPHFFICASGEIEVRSEQGFHTMRAGDVIECKPGTKRVTLALTDAVGITIHKTDETDLDKIEAELIEPDEAALFDSRNQLKNILVEEEKS